MPTPNAHDALNSASSPILYMMLPHYIFERWKKIYNNRIKGFLEVSRLHQAIFS